MGEAKQRGTREERMAKAPSKPKKITADERHRQENEALARGVFTVLSQTLRPVLGALRRR